jgi:hypothetical protein
MEQNVTYEKYPASGKFRLPDFLSHQENNRNKNTLCAS